MLNPNAQKWVEALESGEFPQGQNELHGASGFCCLGVACELAVREGVIAKAYRPNDSAYFLYDGERNYLPQSVRTWLGLASPAGEFGPEMLLGIRDSLAKKNDAGMSFEGIAAIIKSEPKGLFKEEKL